MQITLWLGVTTWGIVLKGHSIRKTESHCSSKEEEAMDRRPWTVLGSAFVDNIPSLSYNKAIFEDFNTYHYRAWETS